MYFKEAKNKRIFQKKKLCNLSNKIRYNESILNIVHKNKSLLNKYSNEIPSIINKKIHINKSDYFNNKLIHYYINNKKCRNELSNLSKNDNSFNNKKKLDLLVNINNIIKDKHHQKKNNLFFKRVEYEKENKYKNNQNEDTSLKFIDSFNSIFFKNKKPTTLFYSINNSFLDKNNNSNEEKNSYLSSIDGKCPIKKQKSSLVTKVDSICQTKITMIEPKNDEQKFIKNNIKIIKQSILPSIYYNRNKQLSSNRNSYENNNLSNESERAKRGPVSFEGKRGNLVLDKELINNAIKDWRYEKKKKPICLVNNYYINL